MRCTTSGETLYYHIRNNVLPSVEHAAEAWRTLNSIHFDVAASSGLQDFLQGVVAIHACRRLLQCFKHATANGPSDHTIPSVAKNVARELFPRSGRDDIAKIGRMLVHAGRTNPTIPNGVRARVLGARTPFFKCYLCDTPIERAGLSLDHLWPSSLGGESVDDNLLPACAVCQKIKADAATWESVAIHDLVLPAADTLAHVPNVPGPIQIACHHLNAIEECKEGSLNLKQAYLRIGPARYARVRRVGVPVTFFEIRISRNGQ